MAQGIYGKINADGSRDFPETDILGGSYRMPATTLGLSADTFVVLPPNYRDMERLEALKAEFNRPPAPQQFRRTSEKPDAE